MFALKLLAGELGSPNIDCRQDGAKLDPALGRATYLFNTTIAGIEQADAILLVGTNPRHEAPVLNSRILKRVRQCQGRLPIGLIGIEADLTYAYDYLGAGPETLAKVADGSHQFLKRLEGAERPMLILGQGALARPDGAAVLALAAKAAVAMGALKPELGWNGFNVLHTAAARAGGLDLGFVPGKGGRDIDGILDGASGGEIDVVYLLGADEIEMARLGRAFVIYQGSHGDAGAHRADVILPGAAYTEKNAIYVNTEGRAQMTGRAIFPPGDAREDWKIVRALSSALGKTLPFDTLQAAARHHVRRASASCAARPGRSRRRRGNRAVREQAGETRQGTLRHGDRRLLFHQPDRARVCDHGELERHRIKARATRRPAPMAELWTNYGLPLSLIAVQSVAIIVGAAHHRGLSALRRPQNLGGCADAARAERGRCLGPAANLRRSFEIRVQGADHPGRREQGRVPAGAAVTAGLALSAWAVMPVDKGWAVADINVGMLYHLRHLLACRSTA